MASLAPQYRRQPRYKAVPERRRHTIKTCYGPLGPAEAILLAIIHETSVSENDLGASAKGIA